MKRSLKKERLDLGKYTKNQYESCLRQLGRIGKYLGGDRATLLAFNEIGKFNSVLDVGCGGGDFSILLGNSYPKTKILGIDIAKEAIDYAKNQKAPDNVSFIHTKEPSLQYEKNSFGICLFVWCVPLTLA